MTGWILALSLATTLQAGEIPASMCRVCCAHLSLAQAVCTAHPTSLGTFSADQLRIGMTAADVRAALGAPDQVSRQVLHRRYVEQWFYKKRNVWVNFDGSKGEELRVRYVFPEK